MLKGNDVFDTGMILAPEKESLRRTLRNIKRKEGGKKPWIDAPNSFSQVEIVTYD